MEKKKKQFRRGKNFSNIFLIFLEILQEGKKIHSGIKPEMKVND